MSDKRKQGEESKPADFSEKGGRIGKVQVIRDSHPPPPPPEPRPKPVDKPPQKD